MPARSEHSRDDARVGASGARQAASDRFHRAVAVSVAAIVVGAFVLSVALSSDTADPEPARPWGPEADGVAASWELGADPVPPQARLIPLFARDPSGRCGSYVTPRLREPIVSYGVDEIKIEIWLDPQPPGDYTCEGFYDELVVVELTEPAGTRAITGGEHGSPPELPPGVRTGLSQILIDPAGQSGFWHVGADSCLHLHGAESLCIDPDVQAPSLAAERQGDVILGLGWTAGDADTATLVANGVEHPIRTGRLYQGQTHIGFVIQDPHHDIATVEITTYHQGIETAGLSATIQP